MAYFDNTNPNYESDPEFLRKFALEISLVEERQKRMLADDLHDHVGQALALIKMKLSELRSNSAFCGFETTIEEMRRLLDQTINYTRTLTFELSPPVLYQLGLPAALESLVLELRKKSGKKIQFTNKAQINDFSFSDDVKIALFRACHEFLMNAIKHSSAKKIEMTLQANKDELTIRIEDDGIGFDLNNSFGFGLFSTTERLDCLGINYKMNSIKDKGSSVILYLERS